MSNIPVIIFASARSNGDTKSAIDRVFAGSDYKLLDLLDYTIEPYQYEGTYSDADDYLNIVDMLLEHDRWVFATPVYWYAMSGLMKTFFDRFTDLVTINKQIGRMLKGKSTYLLAVGAEEQLPAGFEVPFQRTSDYMDMIYNGCLYYSIKKGVRRTDNSTLIKAFINSIQRP
jgi:multimeric flavodoxin WrbA